MGNQKRDEWGRFAPAMGSNNAPNKKKKEQFSTGLFDDLPEQIENARKANLNNIFNRMSVDIPGLERKKVNFRKYNCLTEPANAKAKTLCWQEEMTPDLSVSWLIAHSESATLENVASQVGKFEEVNEYSYNKVLDILLERSQTAATRFYEQGCKDDDYIDLREAMNCLCVLDAKNILKKFENGLNCSAYVLKFVGEYTSGINLPLGEEVSLKIKHYLTTLDK